MDIKIFCFSLVIVYRMVANLEKCLDFTFAENVRLLSVELKSRGFKLPDDV